MSSIIPYLLESIACAGILFCFYRIAYFNRRHHQFNRFFLLGTIIISLLLPLIKIPLHVAGYENTGGIIPLLDVIPAGHNETEETAGTPQNNFNYNALLVIVYLSISAVFFVLLLKSLLRIFMLYTSCPKQRINNIETVLTHEKNSPFSFFRTIFWNRKIDFNSSIGKKIFEHEKTHVDHLHSIDRLLVNGVLTVFWFNPFFWLIKKGDDRCARIYRRQTFCR